MGAEDGGAALLEKRRVATTRLCEVRCKRDAVSKGTGRAVAIKNGRELATG
jgi:hypothetical protein